VTYFPGLSKVPPKRTHSLRERRPLQLHLGWGLLMLCWLGMLGLSVSSLFGPKSSRSNAFWLTFWALAVSAMILRGWWGGPRPWVYLRFLALFLGPLSLIGTVIFFVLAVTSIGIRPSFLLYYLPAIGCGAALLAGGILLSTRPVRTFYGTT
jgi:hypothetical protein